MDYGYEFISVRAHNGRSSPAALIHTFEFWVTIVAAVNPYTRNQWNMKRNSKSLSLADAKLVPSR